MQYRLWLSNLVGLYRKLLGLLSQLQKESFDFPCNHAPWALRPSRSFLLSALSASSTAWRQPSVGQCSSAAQQPASATPRQLWRLAAFVYELASKYMLGVFSFHFCQPPIVFHGFGFCKYVYIGVSFFVSPLSFFKENHESNTEMKRPLLKWLMIILRLPHMRLYHRKLCGFEKGKLGIICYILLPEDVKVERMPDLVKALHMISIRPLGPVGLHVYIRPQLLSVVAQSVRRPPCKTSAAKKA